MIVNNCSFTISLSFYLPLTEVAMIGALLSFILVTSFMTFHCQPKGDEYVDLVSSYFHLRQVWIITHLTCFSKSIRIER